MLQRLKFFVEFFTCLAIFMWCLVNTFWIVFESGLVF